MTTLTTFFRRLLSAAVLNASVYEEVEADKGAMHYKGTGRAIGVCALGWVLSIVFAFVLGLLFGPTVASAENAGNTTEQRLGGTPPTFITPSLSGRDNVEFFCAPCTASRAGATDRLPPP